MNNEILDKIEKIIKLMKDIDAVLCPSCNKYEKCKGCGDWDCLQSTAIKARKMRGDDEY